APCYLFLLFFFFQAEDGIRDKLVTGVQTCALPICAGAAGAIALEAGPAATGTVPWRPRPAGAARTATVEPGAGATHAGSAEIGRSEERRVGKECRSRGAECGETKKGVGGSVGGGVE